MRPSRRPGLRRRPLTRLLSAEYNDERRRLVDDDASAELRPGGGRLPTSSRLRRVVGAGEPTRALGAGDTVHLDVADRFGNLVSATPSGAAAELTGDPELGWPLGTRADVLARGRPAVLARAPQAAADDARPRSRSATASRTSRSERPAAISKDQWTLHVFLRHVVFGDDLQAAIDAPGFHTDHFLVVPSAASRAALARVGGSVGRGGRRRPPPARPRRRGHRPVSLGRVSAVSRRADGTLRAGANPRGMQGYAAGR